MLTAQKRPTLGVSAHDQAAVTPGVGPPWTADPPFPCPTGGIVDAVILDIFAGINQSPLLRNVVCARQKGSATAPAGALYADFSPLSRGFSGSKVQFC